MNKCERCNIYIMDQTTVCPLCNTVLTEVTEKPEDDVLAHFFEQLGHGAKYPDVRRQNRMVHLLMRILLFCFLLTEAFLVYLNVHYTHGIKWSGITGIAMLYFYFSLSYWIRQDSGYAAKIGLQLLITLLLVVGIDFFIGFRGWSLSIAAPSIVIFGDAIVAILMAANRSQWYSYILLLFWHMLLSVGIILLRFTGRLPSMTLAVISLVVTAIFLLAITLFGERALRRELKRRFHI